MDDPHSFAEPENIAVKHIEWDATIDFNNKKIVAVATWTLKRKSGDTVTFDINALNIKKVTNGQGNPLKFSIGNTIKFLGSPLKIALNQSDTQVVIHYATQKEADALQWLSPKQTAGKKYPFLYTQSQAILARTWLPIQDSPGIRFTYNATIKVPKGFLALMSAQNPTQTNANGMYRFSNPYPIPSYLMALVVGHISYEKIGDNTGVYAEPAMLDAAVYEFADMQKMFNAAQALYGKYRWGKYNVIVLPPSFPFGGMENPMLTFATPTILAGDRSLTTLIAHELAHSWSGNLVTNATWNDFWLNEGFTVYIERRIMEYLYSEDYVEMLAVLGYRSLKETLIALNKKDKPETTHLKLNLKGQNPDDGLTDVAYEKGSFFLETIESAVGREKFDKFLTNYFNRNAFTSMTTEHFLEVLNKELLSDKQMEALNINAWIYGAGLPENFKIPQSERLDKIDSATKQFIAGSHGIKPDAWTTQEWVYFLGNIKNKVSKRQMTQLDAKYKLTHSGNSEIAALWFAACIIHDYEIAYDEIAKFLNRVGRRKFLVPLYGAMLKTGKKAMAIKIYSKARENYHAVSTNTLDELLGYNL